MQPRCLKCGKNHATRNCLIKERQENLFCINCQDYGHSACYTKCPKFPQPKKGTPFGDPKKKRNFASKWIKEGISFANVVSGEVPNQIPIDDKKKKIPPMDSLVKIHHRKLRPLTVGEVVVVENSLKNRTLWSLARVIQLIPGKYGHVRVARVKTESGELVRPVQRLYNLELQEPETKLPKDLTDSVIRTRRGRKVISPKRLTYA
ncbi:uncharacterized protein TNCV_292701 [Trichonephila clavipes]|nr:uncharacterized protein TNCV_292701 [Trichonephila clavipes]